MTSFDFFASNPFRELLNFSDSTSTIEFIPNSLQLNDHHDWVSNSSSSSPLPDKPELDTICSSHQSETSHWQSTWTWDGVLPPRTAHPSGYSCKVFLGGIPHGNTEGTLMEVFRRFAPISVEWPGKKMTSCHPKGYAYIIFESESAVRALLENCTMDHATGSWYYKIGCRENHDREVEVIPWNLGDATYVKSTTEQSEYSKTVFVRGIHRMLNAEGLAKIMDDLFKGVIHARINTDQLKYPKGSGRVAFDNYDSYITAVSVATVKIKMFKWKMQIDPYLFDSSCWKCCSRPGAYFCRDLSCFCYFCETCWETQHNGELCTHQPLVKYSNKRKCSTVPTFY